MIKLYIATLISFVLIPNLNSMDDQERSGSSSSNGNSHPSTEPTAFHSRRSSGDLMKPIQYTAEELYNRAQEVESDEEAFELFLNAGQAGEPRGFYEAGKMVEKGEVSSKITAELLFEDAYLLSIKTQKQDYWGLPIGLSALIALKFKEASLKNNFSDYINLLNRQEIVNLEYVQFMLGQVYEKTLQFDLATKAYTAAGDYGAESLKALSN